MKKIGFIKSVDPYNYLIEVSYLDGSTCDNVQIPSLMFNPGGGGVISIPVSGSMCIVDIVEGDHVMRGSFSPAGPRLDMNGEEIPDSENRLPGRSGGRPGSSGYKEFKWEEGDFGIISSQNPDSYIKVASSGLIALWSSPLCKIVMYPESSNLVSITTDNIKWNMGSVILDVSTDRKGDANSVSLMFATPQGVEKGRVSIVTSGDGFEYAIDIMNSYRASLDKDGNISIENNGDFEFSSMGSVSISAGKNIVLNNGALLIKS